MLCKGMMNLLLEAKNGGIRWRGSRHHARLLWGRARAKPIHCTILPAIVNKKTAAVRFSEQAAGFSSLGGDRTDLNYISLEDPGDAGTLAGLLVQNGQRTLVGSIQNVNLLADH